MGRKHFALKVEENRTDAIEHALKNAVRDVLFKGVVAGSRM